MSGIIGAEGLSAEQLIAELHQGGKLVRFSYTISIVVMTFRRESEVHFIRAGAGTFGKAAPYLALSMVFGWWGFPFGFIYTPISLIQTLSGGRDVTREIGNALVESVTEQQAYAQQGAAQQGWGQGQQGYDQGQQGYGQQQGSDQRQG